MLRVCRLCKPNVYTLKAICPTCGLPTVKPYGSTSPSRYGLIHTLGRTKIDPLGGDGAYSDWMQRHFEEASAAAGNGCLAVSQVRYDGPTGNVKNSQLASQFNRIFVPQFAGILDSAAFQQAPTIILNWHIRFTNGTPNGWTGRGVNGALVQRLTEMCRTAGKRLAIIYTIHETSDLTSQLLMPSGVVSLNPDVGHAMDLQFPRVRRYVSRVPGLMSSIHTTKIDLLLKLVGQYLGPIDKYSAASNLFWARSQQLLRLSNAPVVASVGMKGIVIFGMIMPRHGLSEAVVKRLAAKMNEAGLDASLKIVIAGKESDDTLVASMKALPATNPRVHFAGRINGLDHYAGCRYAISFDELGYRLNASAMVNVVREGHLLFSKRGAETDNALIDRAVRCIQLCEANPRFYLEMLAQSQPRVRAAAPGHVGDALNRFFKSVAINLE